MADPALAIVECRHCGKAYWSEVGGGQIAGGPCCFGHDLLDVERFPNERAAKKAWAAWNERRMARWNDDLERMAVIDERR